MIFSAQVNQDLVIMVNLFLFSLILITQFVSYPLFLKVNEKQFTAYHQSYTFYISIIVIPAMVLELFLSFNQIIHSVDYFSVLNIAILAIIWMSTFFIQVPIHNKIAFKYDKKLIKKLISTNWIRTFAWTCKLFICILINYKYL
tara:strand:- start:1926 stop:2357 length:432 start_codon:yes stop_codon:yes gene_type:complete